MGEGELGAERAAQSISTISALPGKHPGVENLSDTHPLALKPQQLRLPRTSGLNRVTTAAHRVQTAKGYLRIGDSKIYYETAGEGEPLILLHGGFGSNEDFAKQTPELAKHFRVFVFERPGHGHSADTEPFTFDNMSASTAHFIETLNLAPANLVGWSDGAIITLLLAISRPDLVRRIVSIGGSFNANSLTAGATEWLRKATVDDFRKIEAPLVERYERVSPDGPEHFPVIFEKTKRLWLEEPNIQPEELARITAPTLVMAGDRDVVTAEHTLQLFRSIKKAELCIVPGTSHNLLTEKPEASNRAILDFLLSGKSELNAPII